MYAELAPDFRSHSFGGQHLHSPRVYLHHVHHRIAEHDAPQLLVTCDFCSYIVLEAGHVSLASPQHDQTSSV